MKKNTLRLYKHYCELVKNPKGNDTQERQLCRILATNAKNDLEYHFKNGKKYRGDPVFQALFSKVEEVKEEVKQEVKEDGKKSKR